MYVSQSKPHLTCKYVGTILARNKTVSDKPHNLCACDDFVKYETLCRNI